MSVKLNNLPTVHNGLTSYVHSVNSIPILSEQEEKELAYNFKENEDVESAKRLVLAHLRFVVQIARGYSGYGLSQADLIQEGNIGLMKAVRRFDPDYGVRLVSFAVHWIKAEIHEYVLKNWRIVKVATTKAQRRLFFNLRRNKKRLGWFSQQEVNDVAKTLGVAAKDVQEMEARLNARDKSFDVPQNDDDDNSVMFSPEQYLEDIASDPYRVVSQETELEQNKDKLAVALQRLDMRSRDIIMKRWLTQNDKVTLQTLAEQYNVSAERVRQLEKNAMQKLKQYINLSVCRTA